MIIQYNAKKKHSRINITQYNTIQCDSLLFYKTKHMNDFAKLSNAFTVGTLPPDR